MSELVCDDVPAVLVGALGGALLLALCGLVAAQEPHELVVERDGAGLPHLRARADQERFITTQVRRDIELAQEQAHDDDFTAEELIELSRIAADASFTPGRRPILEL